MNRVEADGFDVVFDFRPVGDEHSQPVLRADPSRCGVVHLFQRNLAESFGLSVGVGGGLSGEPGIDQPACDGRACLVVAGGRFQAVAAGVLDFHRRQRGLAQHGERFVTHGRDRLSAAIVLDGRCHKVSPRHGSAGVESAANAVCQPFGLSQNVVEPRRE